MDRISLTAVLTNHFGQSGTGLSPRAWSRIRSRGTGPDGTAGYFIGDDFLNFSTHTAVASNVGKYISSSAGYWESYEDTGGSIAQRATAGGGGHIRITTDATDNDEVVMQLGTDTTVVGMISDTAADAKLLVAEFRFKLSQVASGNYFFGLTEEASAATGFITDAGVLVDKDYIGFQIREGTPTTLRFTYKKAGQTLQDVGSYGTALAADTYYKAALVYDPAQADSKKIAWYVDNVEQTSFVTATNIAAATFPDGEELTVTAAVGNGAATATALDLDWFGVYQEA